MRLRRPLSALALLALLLGSCDGGPTGPNVGTLEVTVTGLPVGADAAVTVSNDDGFSQLVTATTTLEALPSGRYMVTPANAIANEDVYMGSAAVEVRVRRGATTATAATYTIASGSITFDATGLPEGATATALLTFSNGTERVVPVPGTARGLLAGFWTIAIQRATADGHGFDASNPLPVQLAASTTPVVVPLTYALATGGLDIAFEGLPDGLLPSATLYSPTGAFVTVITASEERRGLQPGLYKIVPVNRAQGNIQYRADSIQVLVTVGLTPAPAPLTYTPRNGNITLTAEGLPPGAEGEARVRGPAGFDQMLAPGDTLKGVPIGIYDVDGVMVADGSQLYGAGGTQQVEVIGAETVDVELTYAPDVTFNIEVDAAYLVQSTQTYVGDVPLIAGRDALVRIFGVASAPNNFFPPAVARILDGVAVVYETDVPPPAMGVPTDPNQATLNASWNVEIPGEHIQPGRTLQVVIDPLLELSDANRADNTLEVALDIRSLPPFRARFVPIRFATGQEGDVTESRAPDFLRATRAMMPVDSIDFDIRAAYTTSQPFLATSVGSVWSTILGEVNAVRIAEGTGRYYMGIVKVGYNSGIAGIGYVPGFSTVTWDYLPSGDGTLAHELGHNLHRFHAPCGGPAGVDGNYPYPDADIGVYGYDFRTGSVRAPSDKDLMSYCSNEWISDYTFRGALARRELTELPRTTSTSVEDVLLISGRIEGGAVILNPVFALRTIPELPQGGPHRLELRDASGRTLYSAGFTGLGVTHVGDGTDEHFAFAVPRAALAGGEPAMLQVQARGGIAELRAPVAPALRVAAQGAALRSGRDLRVTWSDPAVRGMIIRDAATGRILTIAYGPSALIPAQSGDLEILASDGLRTTVARVRPASQ